MYISCEENMQIYDGSMIYIKERKKGKERVYRYPTHWLLPREHMSMPLLIRAGERESIRWTRFEKCKNKKRSISVYVFALANNRDPCDGSHDRAKVTEVKIKLSLDALRNREQSRSSFLSIPRRNYERVELSSEKGAEKGVEIVSDALVALSVL